MKKALIGGFCFCFVVSGCVPRNYETPSTTTTTLTTSNSDVLVADWNSINECDEIVSVKKRMDCYIGLMELLDGAIKYHGDRAALYQSMFDEVSRRACSLSIEQGLTPPASCTASRKAVTEPQKEDVSTSKKIVMDVYTCEICASASHFVRGADSPEVFPSGWEMILIQEGKEKWIELRIDGKSVGPKMDSPFSHYVITNSKGGVTTYREEGYRTDCGAPYI